MARRFSWTPHQLDKLNAVQIVLKELEAYKPLTLRQIYYQLVSKEVIENTTSQYGMLSGLLKWARLDGKVSWDDVEDRVRAVHSGIGWDDKEEFIEQELDRFLEGYRRHLVQSQDVFLEVWIEKDALSRLCSTITKEYCVSTVVCRGFSSVTFLHEYANRVDWHRSQGQEPVMLYFGDFDPSGEEMAVSMGKTLRDEMGIEELRLEKVALRVEDIAQYRLPHDPRALKKTDTRAKKHVERYGELAVELDALPPNILEGKIRVAIEAEIEVDLLNEEMQRQESERMDIEHVKEMMRRSYDRVEKP